MTGFSDRVLHRGQRKNSLQISQVQWDRCLDLGATAFEIKPEVSDTRSLYIFFGVKDREQLFVTFIDLLK